MYFNINQNTAFSEEPQDPAAALTEPVKGDANDGDTYYNLGIRLSEEGKIEESVSCYRKAVEINPRDINAWYNMAMAFNTLGKTRDAIECYRKVLAVNPEDDQACNNLGILFKHIGKTEEAVCCYRKAIEINPDHARAYFNIGNILRDQGKADDAISNYKKALEIDPHLPEAHSIIGALRNEQGKTGEAFSCYQKALKIRPDPGLEVRAALLLPVICESRKSIHRTRQTLLRRLQNLSDKAIRLEDPLKQVGVTSFLLPYHGLNDRKIQENIASFYLGACPDLAWTSPHCKEGRQPKGKIRVGIISTFLHSHTIGQLFHGTIKHLPRRKFHVTVFRFSGKEDALSREIDQSADAVVCLPYELKAARLKISEHRPDILFYLDIGMDPMTYFLAFSRLAPVQCTTWGHPNTTGIPNMDYFISSQTAEPPGAENYYSECLILLKRLGIYFHSPHTARSCSRHRFDLPEDRTLYICPQSLFKFHPDFDNVLGQILRQDRNGLLVLLEGRDPHWSKLLLNRLSPSLSKSIDQIRFLPRMSHTDFLALFKIADAVLDTPIFSGGKTSLDCFSSGIPIVTLPGRFMRGRLTLAQYKEMGIMDCIANTANEYVNIALRLANDKPWRDKLKEKIKARSHVLFENMEAIDELASFFEQAVEKTTSVAPQRLSGR